MKKAIIILATVIVSMTLQAQIKEIVLVKEIRIFEKYLPKTIAVAQELTSEYILEVWNEVRYYPSKLAFIEAHPKGLFPLSDVDKVWLLGQKIRGDIDSYRAGLVVKEVVETDSKDGLITTKVYFTSKDRTEFIEAWREKNSTSLLDIERVYRDYGTYWEE
jgi:hypothetical protein